MLTYVNGSLFLSPARVLVNTVNTVGVMGKGIAKDFKHFFPEMFREYQLRCENGLIDIGKLYFYRGLHKGILNFPTKRHWRQPSKPEYIEAGLRAFVGGYAGNAITSIAFPRLGCGNGELDWEGQVRPLMEKYLGKLPIDVFVHHYERSAAELEHLDIETTKLWLRSEPESLSFSEVWEDLVQLLRGGDTFRTVGEGQEFRVRLVEEPETGFLIEGEESLFVPRDSLLETWQGLRAAGFMSAASLVDGLDSRANQIMAIFAALPYVRLTQISQSKRGEKDGYKDALQFLPRPAPASTLSDELPQTAPV